MSKEKNWQEFIDAEIGKESLSTMIFFASNILYIEKLLILEGVVLAEFDDKKREPQVPSAQRLKIVQVGQLDALSKIMMMMESMFVTIKVLKNDKHDLWSKLQDYRSNDVWNVVNDILDEKISINSYWKIMGFPKINKLGLNSHKSRLLKKLFDETIKDFLKKIKWLATFYEQHSRLYNKFKHGLSIRFGYKKTKLELEAPEHLLIAFDYNSKKELRKTIVPIRRVCSVSKPKIIVSKTDDSVWTEYSKAMSYTREVVVFAVKNNLVRLQNFNKTFIPFNYTREGKKKKLELPDVFTNSEKEELTLILNDLEQITSSKEFEISDYGTLDEDETLIKLTQRLKNEDVVELV